MRRIAAALLLPLPFAALPLLALAFPATSDTGPDPLLTVVEETRFSPITAPADEPLAMRTGDTPGALIDCAGDLADQS